MASIQTILPSETITPAKMRLATPEEKTAGDHSCQNGPLMDKLTESREERKTPKHQKPRPRSPLNLIEEKYADNEWHFLVACIYDARTAGPNAPRMLQWLLQRYPDPEAMQCAKQVDILRYFNALDMQARVARLKQLADSYARYPPKLGVVTQKKDRFGREGFESEIAHLKGLTRYHDDAWKIFCRDGLYGREWDDEEAQWGDVDPEDPYLKAYVEWLGEEGEIKQEIKQVGIEETVNMGNRPNILSGRLRLRLFSDLGIWLALGLGLAYNWRLMEFNIIRFYRLFQCDIALGEVQQR
ncbi:hypothetical protein ASPVEDRAFT_88471 [Aspergillus versicolor CBS 583.65]|uniref:Uncharacterized protein n=1 Tax=Aspergillus versicolor CBS 583.65 TaxID=1036611 RepID=A0A1L9Q0B6_ASPVE|nr:uncharacterized protein ASPVEDRAFT_88471 [Aspergillus versicolor CBS 583.65]OJJ07217.1 hypothetical protein ASPVEDRAFT_88471 [Aspergillus versicolor CBS 583.65]